MQEIELKILKESLPRGAQKEIAETVELSYKTVSAVLNNRRKNMRVIEEAIKYKKIHLLRIKEMNNQIKKTI